MTKITFILFCLIHSMLFVSGQSEGKTVNADGTRIYYEVTGMGPVVLLLHGDVFGYVDEFSEYMPLLTTKYKVIAVAMRGHGRSELGKQPLTYELLANDVLRVLKEEQCDSVAVVGFSAGASLSYYLAAKFPERITKVVAMAGATQKKDFKKSALKELKEMQIDSLLSKYPSFIKYRISNMAEPERYQELIDQLKKLWFLKQYIPGGGLSLIKAPVLVVGGDADDYFDIKTFVAIKQKIANSKLAIIPGCDHVGLLSRKGMFKELILPFLDSPKTK
jgi:pimeloyl-ACP methyl ester carboxylesterase